MIHTRRLFIRIVVCCEPAAISTKFLPVLPERPPLPSASRAGCHVKRAFDAMPSPRNRFQKMLGERNDSFLALRGCCATQLGITLASLALGWIGEPAFAHLIEPLGTRAGLAPTTREAIAAALSFLLITFLHIVFGELAPKSLAIQRSDSSGLYVAGNSALMFQSTTFYNPFSNFIFAEVGDIWAEDTEMGSVVSKEQFDRVSGFVDRAQDGCVGVGVDQTRQG